MIKSIYKKVTLLQIDLFMLSVMILSLASIEAPKNIFLVGFLLTRAISEICEWQKKNWTNWDSLFLSIFLSALLSTLYAGMSHLEEWNGFKVFLTAILTGWLLSRTKYSRENYQGLFKLIILSALPPLFWGLYQYLIIHSKASLELHSVGHQNHSAIYLVMIFGASLAWFLSYFDCNKTKIKLLNLKRTFLGILSLIFFLSLIIGESRAAFCIGILLGLLIFYYAGMSKKIKILGSISIVLIIFLAIFLKTGLITKQISNQKANNVLSYRTKVWNVSIEASRFSPLLGIGLSNWHFITLDQLKKSVENRGEKFDTNNYYFPGHSHSLYLSALVERGIIGLLVTLIFMIFWLKHILKTYSLAAKSKDSTNLWTGSLSAWVATFGIGLVNTTFHHEHAILACLLLGIYISYSHQYLSRKIN
jgi:O-antigen ligase